MPQPPTCFQIDARDNVATLLESAARGEVVGVVGSEQSVTATEAIEASHKIATADIGEGEAVVKYGVTIGVASKNIARGAWVHLHNCASKLDERSQTLDQNTGAPTDTAYE